VNFLSILLLVVLGIAIIATTVWLIVSIVKNFQIGQYFRVPYIEKISKLRFGRMLTKHGISAQQLLHSQPISKVEMQMKNCNGCIQTSECDRILSKSVVSEQELEFCPNHESIEKVD
jgi:uncharacterized protein DUF6455